MAVCYRHPDRETGVSCSNCGNPICPDCMTATPVGMRCPNCARQKTPVRTLRTIYAQPTATYVLMAVNILVYLGLELSGSGRVYLDLVTLGSGTLSDGTQLGVAHGELWRLVTGGFLHSTSTIIHILFNMYALYWLGTMLEPVLGHARFLALYFASLLAGSFGVMLLSPEQPTVGASGAVFGLMAAAFVMQRARGIDPMRSGLGVVILLNLAITFFPGFNISIGGHLGGLVGGAVTAFLMDRVGERRRGTLAPVLAGVLVGAVSAAGAVAVAGGSGVA
jgi:membrane associated rhomboid family serine protease